MHLQGGGNFKKLHFSNEVIIKMQLLTPKLHCVLCNYILKE